MNINTNADSNSEAGREIARIRSGLSGGATFNAEGAVWSPADRGVDLVSLFSVNIPRNTLSLRAVEVALVGVTAVLGSPNTVVGVFAFSQDGEDLVSVDLNAVVPQGHRANTLDFAKDNDQVAIWDAREETLVATGGKGNTRLTNPDAILTALGMLVRGERINIEELL